MYFYELCAADVADVADVSAVDVVAVSAAANAARAANTMVILNQNGRESNSVKGP